MQAQEPARFFCLRRIVARHAPADQREHESNGLKTAGNRVAATETARKADFNGLSGRNRCELGLQKYVERTVDGIREDEPDFPVWLSVDGAGPTLILDVEWFEDDTTNAKHHTAKPWVVEVDNRGALDRWMFQV